MITQFLVILRHSSNRYTKLQQCVVDKYLCWSVDPRHYIYVYVTHTHSPNLSIRAYACLWRACTRHKQGSTRTSAYTDIPTEHQSYTLPCSLQPNSFRCFRYTPRCIVSQERTRTRTYNRAPSHWQHEHIKLFHLTSKRRRQTHTRTHHGPLL